MEEYMSLSPVSRAFPELRSGRSTIGLNIEVYQTRHYWLGEAVKYGAILAMFAAVFFL